MANTAATRNITMVKAMKIRTRLVPALLCLTIIWGLYGCNRAADTVATESSQGGTAEEDTEPINKVQVTLDGKEYAYNDHLSNFLFMGVDKQALTDTTTGSTDAGQTDALFLLSWDRVTGDVTLISIPRDTITTINVFGRDGTDLGPVEQQISLAYGYGDGKHESCKLTKEAVSRLFYRIPIQGYMATTLDALEEMSNIIGPVTVTVPNDSLASAAPEMTQGAQVEITQDNIELFVRTRDTGETNTALLRLERQNAFLEAAYEKVFTEYQTNPKIITKLYEGLEPYFVTNIGNDQLVKIMEGLAEGGSLNRFTVPGEGVSTETYDEFHVDEDALYEQIVLNFFEEVS